MKYEAPKVEAKQNVAAEFGSLLGKSNGGGKKFQVNGS